MDGIDKFKKKKLMIPDSKIPKCPEFEVKSKIGNMIKMGVNIYYLELIFILVNIFQQLKLMKKVILTDAILLRKKDKKHQKKNLDCKFIRTNTSNAKNEYELDYEVGDVQTFIDELKNKKIKKLEKKLKNEKDKDKELKEKLEKEKLEKEIKEKLDKEIRKIRKRSRNKRIKKQK